jgi:surface polysaccharide O-acyltransferase-like enzyme
VAIDFFVLVGRQSSIDVGMSKPLFGGFSPPQAEPGSNVDLRWLLPNLRFLAVLAIVGLHSQTIFIADREASWFDRFFQEWSTSWLLRVGLPVLSAISGFLMLSDWRQEAAFYGRKIKRRVHSLLIPFVCVSFLTILAYAGIQALPGTSGFFAPPLIRDWDLSTWWHRSLIDPLNYPVYFLRDLFLVALVAPFLAFLLKRAVLALPTLAVLFLCWWFQQDLLIWNIRLLAWFSLGGALVLHPEWRWRLDRRFFWILLVIWLGLSGYGAWVATETGDRSRELNHLSKLIGVVLFFFSVLAIRKDSGGGRLLARVTPWCFPMFLFHNPVVNIGKKIPMKLVGDVPVLPSFVWVAAWLGTAGFLVLILAPLGSKYGGKFWAVITGGRR